MNSPFPPAMTPASQSQFDPHGRCLPGNLKAPVHPVSRRYFHIPAIEPNLAALYQRFDQAFGIAGQLSEAAFSQRVHALREQVAAQPDCANLLQGACVPFILPRITDNDPGQVLETRLLPALEASFHAAYPDYRFVNHHKASLADTLAVRPGSRHEQLLAACQQGVVVGCYFPCLSEYSFDAALERVQQLPPAFILAGAYDTLAALIGTPGLLLNRDTYPPLLWLSALTEANPLVGYHLEAYGYNLTFNRRAHLNHAAEYWHHGLSLLG